MIKKQIIKEGNKPIAIILDFQEYKRLKEMALDKADYTSASKIKQKNAEWISHKDLKKKIQKI